jgi:hypothetical protein
MAPAGEIHCHAKSNELKTPILLVRRDVNR